MKGQRSPWVKWTIRVFGGVLVTLAIVICIAYVQFNSWRAERIRTLESESRVVNTSRGAIEYVVEGQGIPHLYIHGSPGGYENGLAARRAYPHLYRDAMTITASRPGYLRTPLGSGQRFEEQADLYAALLDQLRIDRTVIVASSGGGYIGLQFALRHPHRCLALVLMAPSASYEPDADGPPPRALWTAMEFGMWAADEHMGTMMMKGFDRHDPRQVRMLRLVRPLPISSRVPGALNDGAQRKDPSIDQWPLASISVPILILHGNADENSDYAGSVRIASQVPGAKLITFDGGDHYFPITRLEEVQTHIRAFVEQTSVIDSKSNADEATASGSESAR